MRRKCRSGKFYVPTFSTFTIVATLMHAYICFYMHSSVPWRQPEFSFKRGMKLLRVWIWCCCCCCIREAWARKWKIAKREGAGGRKRVDLLTRSEDWSDDDEDVMWYEHITMTLRVSLPLRTHIYQQRRQKKRRKESLVFCQERKRTKSEKKASFKLDMSANFIYIFNVVFIP